MHKRRTLKQLLVWFVSGLLLLLLLGNLLLNVIITRDYLQTQLESHAQDAATSLGLSLSNVIDARDKVLAERMIDAIFDSGDYQSIVFLDVDKQPIIERRTGVRIEKIPAWFTDNLPLETPEQSAQVMAGWSQLGTLNVASHPGYAYIELWQVAKTQLFWFALVGIMGLVTMRFIVASLLKPLDRMEEQAHEMAHKRFDMRAPIPKTRELARVAEAMNEMADTLGHVFNEQLVLIEGLRERSVLDGLTGLYNREGFDQRLRAELESEDSVHQGTLFLVKLKDFESVNQQHGREEGDKLLSEVASVLKKLVSEHPGGFAARRTGADFTVFLPSVMGEMSDDVASKVMAKLSSLHAIKHILHEDILHLGAACVREGDNCGNLLSKADMALRQAQSRGVSAWQRYAHIAPDAVLDEVRQANEWLGILQKVLAEQSVILHMQKVFTVDSKALLYKQVLARLEIDERLVVAGLFMPMVERFDLSVTFDRMVVEKAIELMADQTDHVPLCITLSESSLSDESFLTWLESSMIERPDHSQRLIFELPEHVVNYNEAALKRLCDLGRQQNFGISIERFGASSVPFSYLQRVKANVIKVDQSFIRNVHDNQANQFFLRSAIQIARSQGIQIVAVGVEAEPEWNTLKELGMDGAMGYYLAKPEAFA